MNFGVACKQAYHLVLYGQWLDFFKGCKQHPAHHVIPSFDCSSMQPYAWVCMRIGNSWVKIILSLNKRCKQSSKQITCGLRLLAQLHGKARHGVLHTFETWGLREENYGLCQLSWVSSHIERPLLPEWVSFSISRIPSKMSALKFVWVCCFEFWEGLLTCQTENHSPTAHP